MAGYGSGRYGRWRYSRTPNDRETSHVQSWVGGMQAGSAQRVASSPVLAMGWLWGGAIRPNKQHSPYMAGHWPAGQQTIAGKVKTLHSVHRWPVAMVAGTAGIAYRGTLSMAWRSGSAFTAFRVLETQDFALIGHWPVDVLIRPTYVWNPDPSPVETWTQQLPETEFWQEQDRTNVTWKNA